MNFNIGEAKIQTTVLYTVIASMSFIKNLESFRGMTNFKFRKKCLGSLSERVDKVEYR
jgi:hypothetical protein